MRIGIGEIFHETNTFSSVPGTEDRFRSSGWREGQMVIDAGAGANTYVGGLIDAARELGATLVSSLVVEIGSCGMITRESLESMENRLIRGFRLANAAEPLDGIAMVLHGAAVAEGCFDVESHILHALRDTFGPNLPIGVVSDLHGNITPEMVALADVLLGLQEYPHTDIRSRSTLMLHLLGSVIRDGIRPYKHLIPLPWLLVPQNAQTLVSGPARDIRLLCQKCEADDPDLLQATFFHGFPYADIPQACASVLTLARTEDSAERNAARIARYAWQRRADLQSESRLPAEAIDIAQGFPEHPVVINEASDNEGGGAPGDGTWLLAELLRRNLPDTVMGYIYDPEVARLAHQAGVGARISCLLGGKTDRLHGAPVELTDAYVKCLTDGQFVNLSPMWYGSQMNLGPCARLVVGNVDVLVGSRLRQVMDKGIFQLHGIDVRSMRIIGLKSTQHFRGWWQDQAAHIVPTDPPGVLCANLHSFNYQHVNRDYYPLNPDATFEL